MSEVETPKAQEDSRPYPLPPATFEFLIRSLVFQAQLSLGMMHFGEEKDAPKPDLEMSRHHIDILAMLQQKTKGNLTLEEQRMLENSLTELRFRYVQAVSEQQTAAPASTSGPNQEASAAEGQQS